MASQEIQVPDIGDFTDVPVIEVHVAAGDTVAVDDPLLTLESDKATLDVPSPVAGTVSELRINVGDTVSQGTVIGALTVNKVCLSGLNAIALADQLIGYGEFDVVVAGGMESMTNGPYLLPGARAGYRYGNSKIVDATAHDALYCAFDLRGMGDSTDFYSKQKQITREDQDAYSAQSHERALTARKNGLFDDEIVAVEVPQRRGDPSRSPTTRACGRAPPRRAWRSCARRSPPTAP